MNTTPSWRVLLSFTTVFLLGGITGAAIMRTTQRGLHPTTNIERDWAQREQANLERRLKLRSDQLVQLQPILAQTADMMRQVKVQTARQIADLMKQNSAQVIKLLDDTQKKEFEILIKERQAQIGKPLVDSKTP